MTLSPEKLEEALLASDYFLCTFEQNITNLREGLNLDGDTLDTEFDQQVLVIIHFQGELEASKMFSNKLELKQSLRTVKLSQFKVSGLTKAGFMRF